MGYLLVNVVSPIPSQIWERELPPGLRHTYLHTFSPVGADFHVIYGIRASLRAPNSRDRIAFVASEPPEIRLYNREVLATYGRVFAPGFSYLTALPNYERISSVAPWWVGTGAGGAEHYSASPLTVELSRSDFEKLDPPERDILSVIVSTKARTPLQVQRLKLVDYLQSRMNEVEIWGEGRKFVEDKSAVLRTSRYHLAIENSVHPGYWTEKLSDPILFSNYVFYQGAPDIGSVMDVRGIKAVNSVDLDGTYRKIAEEMSRGAWAASAASRKANLAALLTEQSFHRAIDSLVPERRVTSRQRSRVSRFSEHDHIPGWKKLTDPLYRRLRVSKETRRFREYP